MEQKKKKRRRRRLSFRRRSSSRPSTSQPPTAVAHVRDPHHVHPVVNRSQPVVRLSPSNSPSRSQALRRRVSPLHRELFEICGHGLLLHNNNDAAAAPELLMMFSYLLEENKNDSDEEQAAGANCSGNPKLNRDKQASRCEHYLVQKMSACEVSVNDNGNFKQFHSFYFHNSIPLQMRRQAIKQNQTADSTLISMYHAKTIIRKIE